MTECPMSNAAVKWWASAPDDAIGALDAARRLAAELLELRAELEELRG